VGVEKGAGDRPLEKRDVTRWHVKKRTHEKGKKQKNGTWVGGPWWKLKGGKWGSGHCLSHEIFSGCFQPTFPLNHTNHWYPYWFGYVSYNPEKFF